MRWLRRLCTFSIVFGLISFVAPNVAWGDSLPLGEGAIAIHNVTYSANASTMVERLGTLDMNPQGIMQYNKLLTPTVTTYTDINYASSISHVLSNAESGSISGASTISAEEAISGTTTNSGYDTGDGTYDNPQSVLGDHLDYDYSSTYSENGSIVETGYISGRTSGNYSYSESGSTNGTSSQTGNGGAVSKTYWTIKGTSGSIPHFTTRTFRVTYAAMSDFVEGTAFDVPSLFGSVEIIDTQGNKMAGVISEAMPVVLVTGLNSVVHPCEKVDGHYISPVAGRWVHVIGMISCPTVTSYDFSEFRFPYPFNCYINYDYTYTNSTNTTITNTTSQQTYDIGQQTQDQTNQLKDTTGSGGIMNVPEEMGQQIYEQVTFANQIAGVGSQLATTVASADASEQGFTFPAFEFQGQQIWGDINVSVWDNIPIDIKSRIRLFNTMIFAILWLRSLWNWIASIFGFERIDDSGGTFDDLFEEDESGGLMRRGSLTRWYQ